MCMGGSLWIYRKDTRLLKFLSQIETRSVQCQFFYADCAELFLVTCSLKQDINWIGRDTLRKIQFRQFDLFKLPARDKQWIGQPADFLYATTIKSTPNSNHTNWRENVRALKYVKQYMARRMQLLVAGCAYFVTWQNTQLFDRKSKTSRITGYSIRWTIPSIFLTNFFTDFQIPCLWGSLKANEVKIVTLYKSRLAHLADVSYCRKQTKPSIDHDSVFVIFIRACIKRLCLDWATRANYSCEIFLCYWKWF